MRRGIIYVMTWALCAEGDNFFRAGQMVKLTTENFDLKTKILLEKTGISW